MGYTLPQIMELMKSAAKYIEFEVSTRGMGIGGMFGGVAGSDESDGEFADATEDDIEQLARFLGG